jgi:hypothetical protein
VFTCCCIATETCGIVLLRVGYQFSQHVGGFLGRLPHLLCFLILMCNKQLANQRTRLRSRSMFPNNVRSHACMSISSTGSPDNDTNVLNLPPTLQKLVGMYVLVLCIYITSQILYNTMWHYAINIVSFVLWFACQNTFVNVSIVFLFWTNEVTGSEHTYLVCWNATGGLRSLVRMFFGSAKSATHSDTKGFGVPGWETKYV